MKSFSSKRITSQCASVCQLVMPLAPIHHCPNTAWLKKCLLLRHVTQVLNFVLQFAMFAIVHFFESEEVELVPTKWIQGEKCFWPQNKQDVRSLIKRRVEPDTSWQVFEVHVKGVYCEYFYPSSFLLQVCQKA